jgi:Protein of unknown function (DUF2934)
MNASMIYSGFEQRVRERAYHLWEGEGRPSGRHAEHWLASEQATLAEIVTAPTSTPAKPKAAPKKAARSARAPARHVGAAAIN